MEGNKIHLQLVNVMESYINSYVRIQKDEYYLQAVEDGSINTSPYFQTEEGKKYLENNKPEDVKKWLEVYKKENSDHRNYFLNKIFISKEPEIYSLALTELKSKWQRLLIINKMIEVFNDTRTDDSFRVDYEKVLEFLVEELLTYNDIQSDINSNILTYSDPNRKILQKVKQHQFKKKLNEIVNSNGNDKIARLNELYNEILNDEDRRELLLQFEDLITKLINVEKNKRNNDSEEFNKPRKNSIKGNNIRKNQLVKNEFERLKKIKSHQNKTTDELLHITADRLRFTFEATKRDYYYTPKKLQK